MAYNPYIVVPLATWAIAQVAKFTVEAVKGRIDFRYLYASGGMPSVHSAVVCALATTALLLDGIESSIFGLSAVLAAIVMYDSLGVRRSTGEQAAAINMLIVSLERGKVKLDRPNLKLREILGHKPAEVTVGAVLGVVLAGLFNYDRLGPLMQFVGQTPVNWEFWAYLAFFGALVIGGVVQRVMLRAKRKKSRTIKLLTQRVFTATQVLGWTGLALSLLQYERASYLAWRLWPLLVLVSAGVWASVIVSDSVRTVPEALLEEAEAARKRRWFEWGRGKRRAKRA